MHNYRWQQLRDFLLLIAILPAIAVASERYDSEGNVTLVDIGETAYELYGRVIDKKNKIAYQNQALIRGEKVVGVKHPFVLLLEIKKLNERLEEMAVGGDTSAQIYFANIKLQEARHSRSQYEELNENAIMSNIAYKAMTSAYSKALKWLKTAADNQDAQSALELGKIYQKGDGVNKSNLAAIEWYYKYSIYSQIDGDRESALNGLELILSLSPNHPLAKKLSGKLYGKSSYKGRENVKGSEKNKGSVITGSGFYINANHIITNNHVIEGCEKVNLQHDGAKVPARVVARDKANDLALILTDKSNHKYVAIRQEGSIGLGDHIMVAGYPLQGLLSDELKVTTGIVNSTSGIKNDPRYFQISAPVQPGNSGGPLLDRSGYVSGVVVAKLDAVKMAKATGDIPQNVNFAIKGALIRSFLEINRIKYKQGIEKKTLDDAALAKLAGNFVIAIQCIVH